MYEAEAKKNSLKAVFHREPLVNVQKISHAAKSAAWLHGSGIPSLLTKISCYVHNQIQDLRLERYPGATLRTILARGLGMLKLVDSHVG